MPRWTTTIAGALLVSIALCGAAAAKNCPAQGPCACGDTVTANYTLTASDPVTTTTCTSVGLLVAGADCALGGGTCTSNVCVGGDNAGSPCAVVLDGGNRTIAGPVPPACAPSACTTEIGGLVFPGTVGSTAKNVVVTGFRQGVIVRDLDGSPARANTIQNVTARNNGNATSHEGHGVHVEGSEANYFLGLTIENAADHGIHLANSDENVVAERYGPYCNPIKTTIKNSYRENIFVQESDDNVIQNVESAYPTPNGCASSGACVGAWVEDSEANRILASTFADKGIILVGGSSWNRIGASGTANAVTAPRIEFRNRFAGSPNDNYVTNVAITATASSNCIVFKNPRLCVGGDDEGSSCTSDADCLDGICVRPMMLASGNSLRMPATLQNCSPEVEAISKECVGGTNAGADCNGNGDCAGGGSCQTYGSAPDAGEENRVCGVTCPDDGTCNKSDPNAIVTISASDCP